MRDKLEQLKSRLDSFKPMTPELQAKIDQEIIPRRVHFTNAFGDNSLTLDETRYFLETQRMVGGKLRREFLEIEGALQAIHFLRNIAVAGGDLDEDTIKKLHEVLTAPLEQPDIYYSGQYKPRDAAYVSKDGSLVNFVASSQVPQEMAALLNWYKKASALLHPAEVAARFHYRFSLIHPFMEANGRIVRLLDDFILERAGYGPAIVDSRDAYYEAMRSADHRLPSGASLALSEDADISEFIAKIEEASCASLEVMLEIIEGRFQPPAADLESRLQSFDKIILGENASQDDRRLQEEKEATKLALAREIEETLRQKIRSKAVGFVLTGPVKFQHNNHQYSPLIAEVTTRHKFSFAPAEALYEYYLTSDLATIEKNDLPLKPFMRLISFAILSHAQLVGIFSGVSDFEFGRIYIKQENRAERVLRLQPESLRELLGPPAYQDWDVEAFKKFVYDSLDNYFHLIEADYVAALGKTN